MNNKILFMLTILIVLIATTAFSAPIPKLHVTSPGKGPFAKGTSQVASWWCNECKEDGK